MSEDFTAEVGEIKRVGILDISEVTKMYFRVDNRHTIYRFEFGGQSWCEIDIDENNSFFHLAGNAIRLEKKADGCAYVGKYMDPPVTQT